MRDTRHANCVPCLCHVSGLWCSARDGLICGHGHGEERVEAWIYWRERWHVQALMSVPISRVWRWRRGVSTGVGQTTLHACRPRTVLAWRSRAAEFWLRVANFFFLYGHLHPIRVSPTTTPRATRPLGLTHSRGRRRTGHLGPVPATARSRDATACTARLQTIDVVERQSQASGERLHLATRVLLPPPRSLSCARRSRLGEHPSSALQRA